MRKFWILSLFVLVGLAVAVRAALPVVLARVLEDQVAANTPFSLTIGDVDLELLAGEAVVEGLALRGPETTEKAGPRLLLDRVKLHIDWGAAYRGEIHLHEIDLSDAQIRAALDETGLVDWVELAEQMAADSAEPEPEPDVAAEPLTLVLDRIVLSPLQIEFRHAPSGRTFHQAIDARVDEFELGGDFGFRVSSSGDLGDLNVEGRARPSPLDVRAKVKSQALDLAALGALIEESSLALRAGSLGFDLVLEARADVAPAASPAAKTAPPGTLRSGGTITLQEEPATPGEAGSAAPPAEPAPVDSAKPSDAERTAATPAAPDATTAAAPGAPAAPQANGPDTSPPVDASLSGSITLTGPALAAPGAGLDDFAAERIGLTLERVAARIAGGATRIDAAAGLNVAGLRLVMPGAGVGEAEVATLELQLDPVEVTNEDGQLSSNLKGLLNVSGGRAKLALAAGDGLEVQSLEFAALSVPIQEFALGRALRLGRVSFDEPQLALRRSAPAAAAGDRPGAAAPANASEAAPAAPAAGAEPLRVEMAGLALRGGRLRLDDATLVPEHKLQLAGIRVDLDNLRIPGPELAKLEVRIASLGDEPLLVRASVAGSKIDANVLAKEVALAPFAPYAAAAGGYAIRSGSLSVESTATIDGARVDAPVGLVFQGLSVERQAGDAPLADLFAEIGVSVDTALALLRDPSGRISLRLPIQSTEAGTTVRLAPILRDALVQALTGALTTPLKLAGAALGTVRSKGDPIGLGIVAFAPGSSAVEDAARETLTGVARLLANRPALHVVLASQASRADHRAIAERLATPLAEGAEQNPAPLADALRRALDALVAERVAAVRAALVNHRELAVEAGQLHDAPQPTPAAAPLDEGDATLRIRIGDG